MTELQSLRARIDRLDSSIIELLAQRMNVCREVALVKADSRSSVIQPDRVRQVIGQRRQWAIDKNLEPDFVEQLFRVLLAETHRIEVADHLDIGKPVKVAEVLGSALDTVACRIDHVVVAVADLPSARDFLVAVGFTELPIPDPTIVTATAGGVTVVLVGPGDPNVDAHLAQYGSGVQHIAIEVLNASFVQQALTDAKIPLLTDVIVDSDGHEQVFTVRDPSTGVQLGFISRTGHRVPISGENVRALFSALAK